MAGVDGGGGTRHRVSCRPRRRHHQPSCWASPKTSPPLKEEVKERGGIADVPSPRPQGHSWRVEVDVEVTGGSRPGGPWGLSRRSSLPKNRRSRPKRPKNRVNSPERKARGLFAPRCQLIPPERAVSHDLPFV